MRFNPEINRRHSVRLKGYDYSGPGAYFVAVCAWKRECLFGEIRDGKVILNGLGEIVREEWLQTALARPLVTLDEFAIMPNHIHGIVSIRDEGKVRLVPTTARFRRPLPGSLPVIVGAFKSACTNRINVMRQTPGLSLWQRNYYEHVVRSESELARVREYIAMNPARWDEDSENPNRVSDGESDALQTIVRRIGV